MERALLDLNTYGVPDTIGVTNLLLFLTLHHSLRQGSSSSNTGEETASERAE